MGASPLPTTGSHNIHILPSCINKSSSSPPSSLHLHHLHTANHPAPRTWRLRLRLRRHPCPCPSRNLSREAKRAHGSREPATDVSDETTHSPREIIPEFHSQPRFVAILLMHRDQVESVRRDAVGLVDPTPTSTMTGACAVGLLTAQMRRYHVRTARMPEWSAHMMRLSSSEVHGRGASLRPDSDADSSRRWKCDFGEWYWHSDPPSDSSRRTTSSLACAISNTSSPPSQAGVPPGPPPCHPANSTRSAMPPIPLPGRTRVPTKAGSKPRAPRT